jgi:hypothetical protein
MSVLTSDTLERGSRATAHRLLQAALSGLVVAAGGCSDDSDKDKGKSEQALSDEELSAMCQGKVQEAVQTAKKEAAESTKKDEDESIASAQAEPDLDALCKDKLQSAQDRCDADKAGLSKAAETKPADLAMMCADMVKSAADKCKPLTATADEKTTSSEQKEYTFADLTKKCDERAGYVQIHAACGGHNACAGFSYGDWGPDAALLTEHSCSGVNGCAGLSCVVLPKDSGRAGKDVYDAEFTEPGPSACTSCHAGHDTDEPDVSVFKVYVLPGATRTTANWLDRTAAEQEKVVAFGQHATLADGTAYDNMSPYHGVLSRGEIERVVKHLRTLKPVIETIKLKDK